MSLEILLQAAEYVDRTDVEHGYACREREPVKRPLAVTAPQRPARKYRRRHDVKLNYISNRKQPISCRSIHNELEKNRRAELRGYIEKLKHVVPLESGSSRHTTQRLLINARKLIKSLEYNLEASLQLRDRELMAHRRLRRRYVDLTSSATFQTMSRRTGSRCSTSSNESTESSGLGDCSSSVSASWTSSDESETIDVEECTSDVDSGCDDDQLS